jgi:hypothetical protein
LDPFFSPDPSFSGYAASGKYYENGIEVPYVANFSVNRVTQDLTNNAIVASVLLQDGRILFIENTSTATPNICGTLNPYDRVLEYSVTNYINDYPTAIDKTVRLVKNINNVVISFGGTLVGGVVGAKDTTIHGFNPTTNQWFTYVSYFDRELSELIVHPLGDGTFLIFGGYEGKTVLTPNPNTYIFDPVNDTLIIIPVRMSRTDAAVWQPNNNEVWVLGGQDTVVTGADTKTGRIFNLATYTVYDGPTLVSGVHGVTGIEYNNEFYIWGGYDSTDSVSLLLQKVTKTGGVSSLPLSTGNWRAGYGIQEESGNLLIFAGEDFGTSASTTLLSYSISGDIVTNLGAITARRWFNPVIKFDAFYYVLGSSDGLEKATDVIYTLPVTSSNYASWYLEDTSDHRGSLKKFPDNSLILMNRTSVSILDQDSRLDMWMTFMVGQYLAFRLHPIGVAADLDPLSIHYSRGNIYCTYIINPTAESNDAGIYVIIIDLVRDTITAEFTKVPGV